MKLIPTVVRNFLLFFFLINVFSGVQISQGLVGKLLAGLLFGLLVAAVPAVLTFFKLPSNFGAMFLMSTILAFVYFFLLKLGLFGLGGVGATTINWGTPLLGVSRLDDLTTLVLVSVVTALGSVWLEAAALKRR